MNPKVDAYFAEGCGRCELYQTPQCKVHSYVEPMEHLRSLLLETELKEDFKADIPREVLKEIRKISEKLLEEKFIEVGKKIFNEDFYIYGRPKSIPEHWHIIACMKDTQGLDYAELFEKRRPDMKKISID